MVGARAGVRGPVVVAAAAGALAGLAVWIDRLPPESLPRVDGAGFALLVALALATLASEDLACVAAGMLVARGDAAFAAAASACFLGIFVGDLGLFAAGRLSGGAARRWIPFVRRLDAAARTGTSRWFERHGPRVVFASRFLPGTRLATYVAAGALGAPALTFAAWFALACAVWTPLLVGLSSLAARGVFRTAVPGSPWIAAAAAFAATLSVLAAVRLVPALATRRGRALLRSSWTRLRRWEFWPSWAIYAPLPLTWARLARRHGGPTVFTAANPALPSGGVVGESKSAILAALARGGAPVARFEKIPIALGPADRFRLALSFLESNLVSFPVVVKPDVGERGTGVTVTASQSELRERLGAAEGDLLVQEFVDGPELGIFWFRHPRDDRGRILSVTEKRLPEARGDGRRTLERLILEHPDAPGRVALWLHRFADRLDEVPAAGETIRLSPIGNHCRGAIFSDGRRHLTPRLEEAVEAMASSVEGFHFGRFDLRAPSLDAFREGRDLRILELNGVASEATHIYDRSLSLSEARRVLRAQWTLAFEIGAANRDAGAAVTSLPQLAAMLVAHRGR